MGYQGTFTRLVSKPFFRSPSEFYGEGWVDLGFFPNGKVIAEQDNGDHKHSKSLEEFLLRNTIMRGKRFCAKFVGLHMLVGTFRPIGATSDFKFYLLWCKVCERFSVARKHGEHDILECGFCVTYFNQEPKISGMQLKEISRTTPSSLAERLVLYP